MFNFIKNLRSTLALFNQLKLYWDKIPEKKKEELIEKLVMAAVKVMQESK